MKVTRSLALLLCSSLARCSYAASNAVSPPSVNSVPAPDDELVIEYGGSHNECDNPLDEARILVSVADFLESYYENNGVIPDPQSLPKSGTCNAGFMPCLVELGGCCSGYTCMKTTGGLQRCAPNEYKATPRGNGGYCTRGQPCEKGLQCQKHPTEVDQKLCLPAPARRLGAKAGTSQLKEFVVETGLSFRDGSHRELYSAAWCQKGRTCGRCKKKYFFSLKDKQQDMITNWCNQLCMFECGKQKRRRIEEEDTAHMNMFTNTLQTYIQMLDFGDDCDPTDLQFSWKVAKPGKKL